MDRRTFLKHLRLAYDAAAPKHDGSKYAAGLATEGWQGGYQAALGDVEAVLTHGEPSDQRGYWREARRQLRTPAANSAKETDNA